MNALISKKQLIILSIIVAIVASFFIAFLSPSFVLVFLAAVFLLLLAAKKIEYAILLLAAYTPFEPWLLKFMSPEIYPLARYGGEMLLLALVVVLIIQSILKSNWQHIKTPIDKPLLIFLGLTILSMIINLESPYIWLLGLRQILRYVVLFYLIVYTKPDKKFVKRLLTVLFIIIVIQSAIGMSQAIIGQPADDFLIPERPGTIGQFDVPDRVDQFWESGQRVFATLGRYDKLGIFLCFFMLLAFAFLYRKKKKRNLWPLLLIVFSLPTFILTYSRMSWIGFALGIGIIGILIKKDKKVILTTIILIIFLVIYLGTYMLANDLSFKRLEDKPQMVLAERILELASPNSWRWTYRDFGRQYFIVHTITEVVKTKPILGYGLGRYGSGVAASMNNKEVYDELGLPFGIKDEEGQIDNNWFSLWGEVGTLGVLAWAFVLLSLYIYCFKVYRNTKDDFTKTITLGYLGAMPVVLFQALLGPFFEVRTISLYLWLIGGVIVSLSIKEKTYKKGFDK